MKIFKYGTGKSGIVAVLLVEEDPSVDLEAFVKQNEYLSGFTTQRKLPGVKLNSYLVSKTKQTLGDIDYFRTIVNAQIFPGIDGTVSPMYHLGSAKIAEMKWSNKRIAQHAQAQYMRRPSFVEGKWITPFGTVITKEEYIKGIESRIPRTHPWESKTTIDECEKKDMGISDNHSIPRFTEVLPAGTPFFIGYLKSNEENDSSGRFGILGTKEPSPELVNKFKHKIITHLCLRVIPRMGRSVYRVATSRFGFLQQHVISDEGKFKNIKVACSEVLGDGKRCGGNYLRDVYGDYVCDKCGTIFDTNTKLASHLATITPKYESEETEEYNPDELNLVSDEFTRKEEIEDLKSGNAPWISEDDMLSFDSVEEVISEEEEDETGDAPVTYLVSGSNPEEYYHTYSNNGKEYYIQEEEQSAEESHAAWRRMCSVAPADEVAAKLRAAENKLRHAQVIKLNRRARKEKEAENEETSSKKSWYSGHTVYEGKWEKVALAFARYRVLHAIKHDGIKTQGELVKYLEGGNRTTVKGDVSKRTNSFHPLYQTQVQRAVTYLVKKGRISIEESGTTGRGKVTTITFIQ